MTEAADFTAEDVRNSSLSSWAIAYELKKIDVGTANRNV